MVTASGSRYLGAACISGGVDRGCAGTPMPWRQRVGRVLAHCVGVAGNILVVKLVFNVGDVQPGALPLHRSEIGYSGLHSRKYSTEAPQASRRLFLQPRWSNSN